MLKFPFENDKCAVYRKLGQIRSKTSKMNNNFKLHFISVFIAIIMKCKKRYLIYRNMSIA